MSPFSTLSDVDAKMSRLILLDYASGCITREECLGYLYLLKQGGLFLVEIAGQKTYLSSKDIDVLKTHGIKEDMNIVLDRSYPFTGTTTENQKEHSISFKSLQTTYCHPVDMIDEEGNTFVETSDTRLAQKWLPLLREEMRNPMKKEGKKEEKAEKLEPKKQEKDEDTKSLRYASGLEKEKILECIDRDLKDGLITEEEAKTYREKAENGELMLLEMGGADLDYYIPVDKAQDLLGDPLSTSFGLQVPQTTPRISSAPEEAVALAKGINTAAAGQVLPDKESPTTEESPEEKTSTSVASEAVDDQAQKEKEKKEAAEKAKEETPPLISTEGLGNLPGTAPLPLSEKTPIQEKANDIPEDLRSKGPKGSSESYRRVQEMPVSEQTKHAPLLDLQTSQGKAQAQSSIGGGGAMGAIGSLTEDFGEEAQEEDEKVTPNRYRTEQERNKKKKEAWDEMQKKRKDTRYQTPHSTPGKNPMVTFAKVAAGVAGTIGVAGAISIPFLAKF